MGDTTRTTTKVNKRGVTKVKIKGNGTNLKQKTTKKGKQKIKGSVNKNYKVREKGVTKGKK